MKQNSTVERRLHILKLLEENENVNVNSLSNEFKVSMVTIRKDLRYFEKKNLLIRSRGGAFKQSLMNVDLSIYDRRKQNLKLKQSIALMASKLINNGETIFLDSGTTIMELVKCISKEIETTIITNAVDIAFCLADYPKIRLIMPGGMLRQNSISLVGEQAATTLRNYYCDTCFIGADGIDKERGLVTMNIEEAYLSRISIENARRVIALIDSSKFHNRGITTIIPVAKIDLLITDNGISKDNLAWLNEIGVEVMVAP